MSIEEKFNLLIVKYAGLANQDIETWFRENVMSRIEKLAALDIFNPDKQMAAYKESLGEIWEDIKVHPDLQTMFSEWLSKKIESSLYDMSKDIAALFNNEIAPIELKTALDKFRE